MENKLNHRIEKLIGGIQIQNRLRNGIGTLACIVFDIDSGKPMGLTNKHILRRSIGKPVIQPAAKPHTNEFIIGHVYKKSSTQDCAIFEINEILRNYDRDDSLFGLTGRISEFIEPYEGLEVQKIGQKTGRTFGVVKKLLSKNKFIIIPNKEKQNPLYEISEGGDSGALWVTDETNFKAVGLHTGGERGSAKDKAWAIKISSVLHDLNIRF
ncbi:chymotrypsin family serine protease [Aestuariibaculum sediminum]|uniref:Serine protease n=1 Tax=Aestuariibaculum sediminum TaxID=2770637 RepID=A0A8J6UDX5_9FLAO|nr:hypothetical protein [Aestuariibaculum sediminum]MBD0833279.1 hypothetical protein [Aestuariibaculum sediminum]